jgi:Asp-tRNA(Asn)/Glu-tRNA(Gln) amidotransferase A subunit family amidase
MQRLARMMETIDVYLGYELALYTNLAGHPVMVFPHKFEKEGGFLMPQAQMLTGRVYDESTLLAVADACLQAIGLEERPPLDEFLAQKEEILKDEKFLEEAKLYTD